MNCEHVREQLPDYLVHDIDEAVRLDIEQHLASCEACRQDAAAWVKLGSLPEEQPSPALHARFNAMLAAHQEAPAGRGWADWLAGWWPRRPAFQLALAMLCLAIGLAAGRWFKASDTSTTQLVQLREEVRNMREMVAL